MSLLFGLLNLLVGRVGLKELAGLAVRGSDTKSFLEGPGGFEARLTSVARGLDRDGSIFGHDHFDDSRHVFSICYGLVQELPSSTLASCFSRLAIRFCPFSKALNARRNFDSHQVKLVRSRAGLSRSF
jgi:hypothetical protein